MAITKTPFSKHFPLPLIDLNQDIHPQVLINSRIFFRELTNYPSLSDPTYHQYLLADSIDLMPSYLYFQY